MSEIWRSHLIFDDGSSKQTFSSDEVFIKKLDDDVLNVRNIDFVNDPIYTLSEEFPHKFLVVQTELLSFKHFLLNLH